MPRGGIVVLYVQLTAHFPEGPVIKLLPIVGNQDLWDPEPTDDGLPDEAFDILFRNCRQGSASTHLVK